MIDINLIRENKDLVKENIKKKFQDHKLPLVDEVYNLDIEFRNIKTEADNARSNKNKLSDSIGLLMRDGKKEEAEKVKKVVSELNDKINELSVKEEKLSKKIKEIMYMIPNIIEESVPIGKDDSENVEIKQYGEQTSYDFEFHIIQRYLKV